MSVALTINGTTYEYPVPGDIDWGPDATDWAAAVTTGMLQKAGGLFQLLAEVDFGTAYGVKSLYLKSRTASPADAGQIRLAKTDVINWRNNAGGGNLSLGISATDVLQFNGADLQGAITVSDTATIDLTFAANALSGIVIAGSLTNTHINAAAAIAYSKLALTGAILNADINASAAIAYSKLTLTGSILNADINASAAIAYSKLALTGSILNADINASAAIAYSKLNLTGTILNADINASAAIAYSKLNLAVSIVNADISTSAAIAYSKLALTGSIVNADVGASAAIAFSKLASLTSAHILVGSAGNVATDVAVTGDITITNAGVTAVGTNKITNAMLAQVATATFKGRTTAGTGNSEDLTVTQATALLNALVGDSGSGGTKGLVPAPAAGDAAALKFLKADGTWAAPAGAGDVVGPGSATDQAVAIFSGTTGKLLANSVIGATTNTASTFVKRDSSGNFSAGTITAALTGTASKATNIVGGLGGSIPYQSAVDTTALLANGTEGQFLQSLGTTVAPTWAEPATSSKEVLNLGIAATVGSSAMTINLKQADGSTAPGTGLAKVSIGFRSSTAGTGGYVVRTVTGALSVVVSSGSTLGSTNGNINWCYVYAIDNAGTVELAVCGTRLADDGTLYTTTAEGGAGAADSKVTLYSTTARTAVAVRLIGRVKSTQATAGTWATTPSEVSLLPFNPGLAESQVLVDGAGAGAAGFGSTNTKVRRFVNIRENIGTAITYADSATAGASFTINEDGIYATSYHDDRSSAAAAHGITVNASAMTTNMITPLTYAQGLRTMSCSAAGLPSCAAWTGYLFAGDIIRPQSNGTEDETSALVMMSVVKISN